MNGFISTIEDFNTLSTTEVLSILKSKYPNAEKSQILSWETLINDIKNSKKFNEINKNCLIGLEISLPTDGMAIDLLLCGKNSLKEKECFIIEAKQWNDDYINNSLFSQYREPGFELHPQIQVYRHSLSFKDYLDIGISYNVHKLVFVRNCSKNGIVNLINKNTLLSTKDIQVVNDIDEIMAIIASNLICGEITTDEIINAQYKPSKSIIEAMESIVSHNEPFILTMEQQNVINKINEAINNGKKIIRITGAAGSGKTAILLNMYVNLLNRQANGEDVRPVFVSGAQNTAFYRSAYPEVERSFSYSYSLDKMVAKTKGNLYYVLMDEAQHNQEGIIQTMIDRNVTLILCYDISQVINANNSIAELTNLETREDFLCINLEKSVRFNGSQLAEKNIRNYLKGSLDIKEDDIFEFKVFNDLKTFQEKIVSTINNHPNDTVAVVGLLSNDASKYTNSENPDSILFTKWGNKAECEWLPYINNKNYLSKNNGNLWVGTWWMPGLDVDYVAVIVGGDANHSSNGIKAIPDQAKHYLMMVSIGRKLNLPDELFVTKNSFGKIVQDNRKTADNIMNYLKDKTDLYKNFINMFSQLLRNNYYIMMTRGRKGCFVYFTDQTGGN